MIQEIVCPPQPGKVLIDEYEMNKALAFAVIMSAVPDSLVIETTHGGRSLDLARIVQPLSKLLERRTLK